MVVTGLGDSLVFQKLRLACCCGPQFWSLRHFEAVGLMLDSCSTLTIYIVSRKSLTLICYSMHIVCFVGLQVSKEGEMYEVPVGVAKMSNLVATTIDDDADDDDEVREIPLPNVKDAVLAKVIEFCTHYKEEPMNTIQTPLKSSKIEDLVQAWYAEYVKVEQDLLFELVTAANFMDIKPLLDLTCLAVSVLIKVRLLFPYVTDSRRW